MVSVTRVPRETGNFTLTEKKSRFIGVLYLVETEQDALARLRDVRLANREATHNVYAYRLLDNQIMRHSDDGEPQGTAGLPVLEVLRREEVQNVLCVVTRYFGGVLLGAGGLVRAYAATAKGALDAAGVAILQPMARGRLRCPYPLWEMVERLLLSHGACMNDTEYTDRVIVHYTIPEVNSKALETQLIDITAGRVLPEWLEVVLGS